MGDVALRCGWNLREMGILLTMPALTARARQRKGEAMSQHDSTSDRTAEVWSRFMAAALSAAPHAPIDKLAAIADEALAEYRNRVADSGFEESAHAPAAPSSTTATPFVAHVEGEQVTYEPTAEATDDDIDSPFQPAD